MIKRGDYLVQYDEDGLHYVQEVALLDMGRFKTKEQAIAHKRFLEERDKS